MSVSAVQHIYSCDTTTGTLTLPNPTTPSSVFGQVFIRSASNCDIKIGSPSTPITVTSLMFEQHVSNSSIVIDSVSSEQPTAVTYFIYFADTLFNISTLRIRNVRFTGVWITDTTAPSNQPISTIDFFVLGATSSSWTPPAPAVAVLQGSGSSDSLFQVFNVSASITLRALGNTTDFDAGHFRLLDFPELAPYSPYFAVAGFASVMLDTLSMTVDGVSNITVLVAQVLVLHSGVQGLGCNNESRVTATNIYLDVVRAHAPHAATQPPGSIGTGVYIFAASIAVSAFADVDIRDVALLVRDLNFTNADPTNTYLVTFEALGVSMKWNCSSNGTAPATLTVSDIKFISPQGSPGFMADARANVHSVRVSQLDVVELVNISSCVVDLAGKVLNVVGSDVYTVSLYSSLDLPAKAWRANSSLFIDTISLRMRSESGNSSTTLAAVSSEWPLEQAFAVINISRVTVSLEASKLHVFEALYVRAAFFRAIKTVPGNVTNNTVLTFSDCSIVFGPRFTTRMPLRDLYLDVVSLLEHDRFGLMLVQRCHIVFHSTQALRVQVGATVRVLYLSSSSNVARDDGLGGEFLAQNCSVIGLALILVTSSSLSDICIVYMDGVTSKELFSSFAIERCWLDISSIQSSAFLSMAVLMLRKWSFNRVVPALEASWRTSNSSLLSIADCIITANTVVASRLAVGIFILDASLTCFDVALVNCSLQFKNSVEWHESGQLHIFVMNASFCLWYGASAPSSKRHLRVVGGEYESAFLLLVNCSIVVLGTANVGNADFASIGAVLTSEGVASSYLSPRHNRDADMVVSDFVLSIGSIIGSGGAITLFVAAFLFEPQDFSIRLGDGGAVRIHRASIVVLSSSVTDQDVKVTVRLVELYRGNLSLLQVRDSVVRAVGVRSFRGVTVSSYVYDNNGARLIHDGVELDNITVDVTSKNNNNNNNAALGADTIAVLFDMLGDTPIVNYLLVSRISMTVRGSGFGQAMLCRNAQVQASSSSSSPSSSLLRGVLLRDIQLDLTASTGTACIVAFLPLLVATTATTANSKIDATPTTIATSQVVLSNVRGSLSSTAGAACVTQMAWTDVNGGAVVPGPQPKQTTLSVAIVDCKSLALTSLGELSVAALLIVSGTQISSITVNNSNFVFSGQRSAPSSPLLLFGASSSVTHSTLFGAPCSSVNGQILTDKLVRRTTASRAPSTVLQVQQRIVGPLVSDPALALQLRFDEQCVATESLSLSHPLTLTANETLSHEATQSLTATTTRQFFLKAKREAFTGVAAVTSLGGMLGGGSAFSLTQKMMALQAMSQCPLSDPLAETPEAGLDSNLLGIRIYSPMTFDDPSDVGDLQLSTSSTDAGRVVMASWRGAVISCFVCAVIVVAVSAAVVYGRVLWSNRNNSNSNNEGRRRNNNSRRRSSSNNRSAQTAATMTFEKMSRTMGFPGFTIGAALTVSCASACTALGVIMSLFQAPAVDGPVFGFGLAALFIVPVGVLLWMGCRAHRDEKVKIAEQLPTWTEIRDKVLAVAAKERQEKGWQEQAQPQHRQHPHHRERQQQLIEQTDTDDVPPLPLFKRIVLQLKTLNLFLRDPWVTWRPSTFVDRFSPTTFIKLIDARWMFFDLAVTAMINACGGASHGCRNGSCCNAVSIVTLVAVALHAAALAWLRPYATRYAAGFSAFSGAVSLITSCLVVAHAASSSSSSSSGTALVAQGFAGFGQVVGFVSSLLGTFLPLLMATRVVLVHAWRGWKAQTRRRALRLADVELRHDDESSGRRGSVVGRNQNHHHDHHRLGDNPHRERSNDDAEFLREMLMPPAERQQQGRTRNTCFVARPRRTSLARNMML